MSRRYALLCYSNTGNLGDEIQSLAAKQFLPSVDLLVDRERLQANAANLEQVHQLILNGWFMHRPENWPPHPLLDPLITSFHLSNEVTVHNVSRQRPTDVLLEKTNLRYFERYQPIGTRDLWTLELLQRQGIGAYFSGCLTLTLTAARPPERREFVCLNDLDEEVVRSVAMRTSRPLVMTSHLDRKTVGFAARTDKARQLLSVYAQASCVVTSRLHCALPCLALGTPVLFLMTSPDTYRFTGLISLLRHCSRKEFITGREGFDLDNPGANFAGYVAMRERLIRYCTKFGSGGSNSSRHFVPAI